VHDTICPAYPRDHRCRIHDVPDNWFCAQRAKHVRVGFIPYQALDAPALCDSQAAYVGAQKTRGAGYEDAAAIHSSTLPDSAGDTNVDWQRRAELVEHRFGIFCPKEGQPDDDPFAPSIHQPLDCRYQTL
jgi:hypothetical protein